MMQEWIMYEVKMRETINDVLWFLLLPILLSTITVLFIVLLRRKLELGF